MIACWKGTNIMAETINDKKTRSKKTAGKPVEIETGAFKELEPVVIIPEGFTAEEVARMTDVKERIQAGQFSDITDEYKKLLFVQWLIDHDKMHS